MRSFSESLTNQMTKISHFLTNTTTPLSPQQLLQIQAQIILHNLQSNTTITSNFINSCHSLGLLTSSALPLFHQIHKPHVFICNSLIRAFSHSNSPHQAISIHTHMHNSSIPPNNYTFPFLLKSISDTKLIKHGQSVHAQIAKLGHLNDIYVQNSLLSMYSSCGEMGVCHKVFDEMPQPDVVSWTILIEGNRNAGRVDDALLAFEQMMFSGVLPNRVSMVNALSACAGSGALETGVWIHEYVTKNGWELDVILGTSLIDMYGKCGRMDLGLNVFKGMSEKNVFTWNSVIKGLALAKSGEEAVNWFFRMQEEGVKVDEVTLLGVLCACSHSGLVEIGLNIFYSMTGGKYGFLPGLKHYGCVVDLLGRAGRLEEAFAFIEIMPFEPTTAMWGALVAGCRAQGDLELSTVAATKLVEMEPNNGAYMVLLSNLYAEMGRWGKVEELRKLMKCRGIDKDLGYSFVELESEKHAPELLPPL